MQILGKQAARTYNAIDLMKFVLSVFVMIIHSGMDKTVSSPLLRLAVPLFFIVSSYFFFAKNKKLTDKKEKQRALGRFVKRNIMLYVFWAVVQLPLVLFMRGYLAHLIPDGLCAIVRDFVLGNGFTGSWYILASVVGIAVSDWASKRIPAGWFVLLTLPLYIFCCLVTNYWNLFGPNSLVHTLADGYYRYTGLYVFTSFPVALFWISVGRFLAEKKIEVKSRTLGGICGICAVLLALERYLVVQYGLETTDDCYFLLIFLCPVIFLLVSRWKVTINTRFRLREISALIYVTHGCCERVAGYALKALPFDVWGQNAVKVAIALVMIVVLGHLLIWLREKRDIRCLKYAC